MCSNSNTCKYLCSNETNMCNFQPVEVVTSGTGTQLQVGENLNKLLGRIRVKGLTF